MACSFHSEEYFRKSRPLGLASREHNHFSAASAATNANNDGNDGVSFVGKDVSDMGEQLPHFA